jgi:hypothetical protein
MMRAAVVGALLVGLPAFVHAAADDQPGGAKAPAAQICDAQAKGQINKSIDCLVQAQSKVDAELDALIEQIRNSKKVKDEVLGKDVAPSARQRWRKNLAALVPAFRSYRYKNCEDESITAVGYGMGGLQWRLGCIIDAGGEAKKNR